MPQFVSQRLLRYLLVGGTAFVFEYAVFSFLYSLLGVRLLVANSMSFIWGLVLSFTLQRAWAFKKDKFDKTVRKQFLLFGGLALCNLLVINILLGYLTKHGLDARIGKVVVMLVIVCWNFLLMNRLIFKKKQGGQY